jgi:5-hydroxyisourate hydrolase-like protein (transthyretin family)
VTDAATGKGIAGAKVEAQLAGRGWDYSANAASDGSYAFASLPTGDYKVRVTARGYAREYYDNVNPSHEATLVHVTAGRGTPGINFDLTEGGSISGTIYQRDGVTPVGGARVSVRPSKYFFDDGFQAVTAADGSYAVDGLSLGNYKIKAEASSYAMLKYYRDAYGWDNATSVVVTPPDTTLNINVSLDPAGSISGHIFQSDGVTPIANVGILADTTTGGWEGIPAGSNADGSYTIEGLPPSSYIVNVRNPVGLASEFYKGKPSRQTANILSVAAGQKVTGIDFTLEMGAPITGHVYDEATGAPISGASVEVWLVKGQFVANKTTLPDGSYELWVGTGCYRVGMWGLENAPGYVPEYWNNHYDVANADPVCVTAPTGVTGIDLYLAHAGSISGHVYEGDGTTPVAGASVYAFPTTSDHPGAGANTQPDGSYIIQGLPSGNYKVQVTASGHVSQFYNHAPDEAAATEVTVNAPNDTHGIDFALSPVSE